MPASPKVSAESLDNEVESLLAQPAAKAEAKTEVEAKPVKAEEKPAYKPVDVAERTLAEQRAGREAAAQNALCQPAQEPNLNVKVDLRAPPQMFNTPAPKVTGTISL